MKTLETGAAVIDGGANDHHSWMTDPWGDYERDDLLLLSAEGALDVKDLIVEARTLHKPKPTSNTRVDLKKDPT